MLLLLKWNHCLCKVKTLPDGQNIQTNVLICGDTFGINIDQFGWFSGRKHSPRRKSNFVELVNSNVSGTNFDISGTFCAAAKIGIFNNGCYCQFPKTLKASGNWKIQPESFAASFTLPSPQIESINSDGSNTFTFTFHFHFHTSFPPDWINQQWREQSADDTYRQESDKSADCYGDNGQVGQSYVSFWC